VSRCFADLFKTYLNTNKESIKAMFIPMTALLADNADIIKIEEKNDDS